ncbi:LOW QUALITY PROTEIN: DUF761 domain-containing protein, partial [Cephalotus follicularis]
QNQASTTKFYTHFLYKALIVTVCLVILPIFPSQAPEFINQTLLNRSWELLHLIFVGIAVSYGLFSRRNEETEKENNHTSKLDNAQSYVSRFLQVSSVFDDEADNLSGSDDNNKVQTWNNQYYRNDPVVVVAEESSVFEQRGTISRNIREKPLLLPVRSLKSRVSDMDSEDNFKESVVLPSPIPWRSRSGRMELKEDMDGPPLYTLSPSMEDSEYKRLESQSIRSQTFRSSRPNSTNCSPELSPSPSLSSPKKLFSSPSLSTESQAKSAEDLMRMIFFFFSFFPPPPPPPPFFFKSSSFKPRRKMMGFDRTSSLKTERNQESVAFMPRQTFIEFPEGEKDEFIDNVCVETDDENSEIDSDGDDEDDDIIAGNTFVSNGGAGGSSSNEGAASSGISDGGPDVDKKADEFIAKFREQIRLQRIDSIKRSTTQ